MKLENYGFALNDASKALELDPKYIKVNKGENTSDVCIAIMILLLTLYSLSLCVRVIIEELMLIWLWVNSNWHSRTLNQ